MKKTSFIIAMFVASFGLVYQGCQEPLHEELHDAIIVNKPTEELLENNGEKLLCNCENSNTQCACLDPGQKILVGVPEPQGELNKE